MKKQGKGCCLSMEVTMTSLIVHLKNGPLILRGADQSWMVDIQLKTLNSGLDFKFHTDCTYYSFLFVVVIICKSISSSFFLFLSKKGFSSLNFICNLTFVLLLLLLLLQWSCGCVSLLLNNVLFFYRIL